MRPFRGKKWKKIIIIIQLSKKKMNFSLFHFMVGKKKNEKR